MRCTVPQWLSGKESTCQGRRCGFPGSGRSPGGGNGNPLQYSCLENSKNRRVWWATVHGVTKSQTQLSAHALYVSAYFEELWMVRAPITHTLLGRSTGLAYRFSQRPLRCSGYVFMSPSFCRPHSLACADHIRAQLFSAPGICFSDAGWLMKAHHLFTAGFLFHSLLSTLWFPPVGF